MKRTITLKVRVNPDEREAIKNNASDAEITVSSLLRQLGVGSRMIYQDNKIKIAGTAVSAKVVTDNNHKLVLALNAYGRLLNQLAKKANQEGHTDKIYKNADVLISEFRTFIYQIMQKAEASK